MGVSKESISKFLIGNWIHVKLRILNPYSNRIFIICCSEDTDCEVKNLSGIVLKRGPSYVKTDFIKAY